MKFGYNFPTKIFFGAKAVSENEEALILGRRAFIVAGKSSARTSGALGDVVFALKRHNIDFMVYEGVANNPDVDQCREIGAKAREFGADFIIGIGGGSPLDAAKAVAVFAVNDIPSERIFTYGYPNGVLPIAAIPTTSGTGSEVTPWAVMTSHKLKTKKSFGGELTFPRAAFLDPRYTFSMPPEVTKSTALDAFTHCFESMISLKASPITDSENAYALKLFGALMDSLDSNDMTALREPLMMVSLIGGMTISHTGTTLMHALGYPLTYFKNVPHGMANAMVMPVYLDELRAHRPDRLNIALAALGKSYEALREYLLKNCPVNFDADERTLALWAEQTSSTGSAKNTGTPVDASHVYDIYKRIMQK